VALERAVDRLAVGSVGRVELPVERVQAEDVAVGTVAGRRGGALVAVGAESVPSLVRSRLALAEPVRAGIDPPGEPVREGAARRVGVVDDECECACPFRRVRPDERRRDVVAPQVCRSGIASPDSKAVLLRFTSMGISPS
jgi:hypothetical protein